MSVFSREEIEKLKDQMRIEKLKQEGRLIQEPESEPSFTYVTLEEYVDWMQHITIVKKAEILFDDRPNEVSIRVEYYNNLHTLDELIVQNANFDLSKIVAGCRIRDCKKIILSYLQKEVIE